MNAHSLLHLGGLAAVGLSLVACKSSRPSLVPLDEPQAEGNRPWRAEIHAQQDLVAEEKYIQQRRAAVGVPADQPTVALCFSGGGERAATICLGVLQGLEEKDLLKRADYLSSVSGGSYAASWFVSHLLPAGHGVVKSEQNLYRGGYASYSDDRATLLGLRPLPATLDAPGGGVDELEARRGFVLGKYNMNLTWLVPLHLSTLPPAYVFDIGLHWKPLRGKFNWHHPAYHYDRAIRRTYLIAPEQLIPGQSDRVDGPFGGQPHDVRLNEINPLGHPAPYLVINATQGNTPDPAARFTHRAQAFEFSRHSVGGPFLGYIHSDHFGFPVVGTLHRPDGSGQVSLRSNPIRGLPGYTTKPLRLATAVAASGAAFDPNGGGEPVDGKFQWPPEDGSIQPEKKNGGVLWKLICQLFNVYTRQQNRNFSMRQPGQADNDDRWTSLGQVGDRLREVTIDRIRPSHRSNSLILTDGGHYDNLGIYTILHRPSVKQIWAFDVVQDGDYKFKSWLQLIKLLEARGWDVKARPGNWLPTEPPSGAELGKVCLLPPGKSIPVKNGTDVWTDDPVFIYDLTHAATGRSVVLYYVKSSYRLNDGAEFGPEVPAFFAHYRKTAGLTNKTGHRFPHTSTGNVSFSQRDFEAYRQIGRVLAWKLAERKP